MFLVLFQLHSPHSALALQAKSFSVSAHPTGWRWGQGPRQPGRPRCTACCGPSTQALASRTGGGPAQEKAKNTIKASSVDLSSCLWAMSLLSSRCSTLSSTFYCRHGNSTSMWYFVPKYLGIEKNFIYVYILLGHSTSTLRVLSLQQG